jgi:type VI secretion system protein ImpH
MEALGMSGTPEMPGREPPDQESPTSRTPASELPSQEAPPQEIPPQPGLVSAFLENPHAFEFFQAMRLLRILHPDRRGVGGFGDPKHEVVRLSANSSISFPASEIHAFEEADDGPHEMIVNFMGLTGPQGVLPLYYSTLVQQRVAARDHALKAFLDLFHHRMISLFYRAWEKSHLVAGYEKDRRDKLTRLLLDLVGVGGTSVQDRLGIPGESLLFYAGVLGPAQRSAAALRQLVEDYFGVPTEVEQFVGGWHPITESEQTGVGDDVVGPSAQLGVGSVVGDELWDPQSRVRIRLGPLSRERFDSFLPTGRAYRELQALTRFFGDDQLDFEVQLVLAREDVPPLQLGAETEPAASLGWGTWIRTADLERDADETILRL